jgi:hypothetical protein
MGAVIPLRPSPNAAPLGLPRAAWRLCYDTIQAELQAQQRAPTVFTALEMQCMETYLLESCGLFLREHGVLDKLWKAGEIRSPFYRFQEHMRLYGERCEESGGDTEAVRRAVRGFEEQLRREMTLCPTTCP